MKKGSYIRVIIDPLRIGLKRTGILRVEDIRDGQSIDSEYALKYPGVQLISIAGIQGWFASSHFEETGNNSDDLIPA